MESIRLFSGLILVSIFSLVLPSIAAPSSFELLDNRIIIQVYINNQGPFSMMFDTGATNILSDEVATALNLNRYNRFPVSGGGENAVYASYCDVQNLEVSTETLLNSRFICMDVSDMQNAIGFPRLDGLIGYEVFNQFLTEINFDKMEIRLSSFAERAQDNFTGQIIPFTFYGPTPLIDATLDGIPGKFLLDTGDRASATLALPFIQRNSLRQKYNPRFSTMTGYGIGGPLFTSMVFVDQFQVAGLAFANTLIRLPAMNSRALNDPNIAGTLGMGLLRQFNILIDYSRREMILSPNSTFTQDRSFDCSGMWISPSPQGFLIRDVLENGPAWQAGLRADQLILSINGVNTSEIDILTLREQLKDPKHKKLTVLVQAGSQTFTATLKLKNLIQPRNSL